MKVLFVVPRFPMPAHSGADIAAIETLRSIHGLCDLHLLTPPPPSDHDANVELLSGAMPRMPVHFYRPRAPLTGRLELYASASVAILTGGSLIGMAWKNGGLRESVESLLRSERFDLVHCEWLDTAASLAGIGVPVLLRTLDVHFVRLGGWVTSLRGTNGLRRWYWGMEENRLRRFEASLLATANSVVTVSREDEELLRGEGVGNIVTIPPPVRIPSEVRGARKPGAVVSALFTGRLEVWFNREAFLSFADEVWPHVGVAIRGRVNVCFAGGSPDNGVRRRAAELAIAIRENPTNAQIGSMMDESDIFLAPLKSGTGIKMKILEAMTCGKAILGFPNTFRGIPVVHGRHALIARSPEEFAEMLCELIDDDRLRARLGAGARDLVDFHFNPGRLGVRLVGAYTGLM